MDYKAVITYNFQLDDTRGSFKKKMEDLGFEDHPDSSTMALPFSGQLNIAKELSPKIIRWSKDSTIKIKRGDFVQLYSATSMNRVGKIISSTFEKKWAENYLEEI